MRPRPTPHRSPWPAELRLTLGLRAGKTRVTKQSHRGPLRVQRAFHPEADGTAHVVVLHPPAGLVGGDSLDVRVDVEEGASALVTSTGAAKAYRTWGAPALAHTQVHVARGATMEHVPLEAVVYEGADAELETVVHLGEGARFLGWEVVCLGRPAAGESFGRGTLRLSLEVWHDGRLCFLERGRIDGGSDALEAPWGLAGWPAFGTMVSTDGDVEMLRRALEGTDAGVTQVRGLTVVRARGRDGSEVRRRLERARDVVRDRWGRPRVTPAIWRS
ncbi:MAG: urease accessory protein UreD [Sandaracinaceae bacterium]